MAVDEAKWAAALNDEARGIQLRQVRERVKFLEAENERMQSLVNDLDERLRRLEQR